MAKGIMRYDEELARQAEEYAEQEANTGGGEFFSIADDRLTFGGMPMPDNQIAAVILDSLLVNAFYADKYVKGQPASPICFAMGRAEKTMAPHDDSIEKQAAGCEECEMNVFGSGEGRGKACKNQRRLALIEAGTLDEERFKPSKAVEFETAKIRWMMLPPTSISGFGTYVKQLAGSLHKPPHAVFTKIKLEEKTLLFEPLGVAPADLVPALIARNAEARKLIEFPFPKMNDQPAKKRGAKKPARHGRK